MATPLRNGNEILINALTNSARQEPGMTALADGRHVVCRTDQSGTSDASALLAHRAVEPLLSDAHFPVDGTLVKAWASMKSFQPKAGKRATGRRQRAGKSARSPPRPLVTAVLRASYAGAKG